MADSDTGLVGPPKKSHRKWWLIALPITVIIILAAVLGGVLGSRAARKNNNDAAQSGSNNPAAASSAVSAKSQVNGGIFATATDSEFMVPLYPSTTNAAAFSSPTFNAAASNAWPEDPFKPSKPSVQTVRPDRPRLIAPAYKWAALPAMIQSDPYLQSWNNTIFGNASDYFSQDPVKYFNDNSSGILDNAREVKERIKAFAYVFRMTNDTKWVERCWLELQNAAGNGTQDFGPSPEDRWNSVHFLDTAEFSAAFGIAYDWLYDQWSPEQKSQIRSTLITYGLSYGIQAYNGASFGWWRNNITGNWNCVSNSGITMASLAILGDDTTGTAEQILGLTIENARQNCAQSVSDDGTWAETANYWYFGTTGHAEMAASLITATGSDYGLLTDNKNFVKTGDYHMYVYGATSLFNYGDHGPNKYSTTANTMLFYAAQYNRPEFALFQRDRPDAAEPWSMFWYDPSISGAFWDGKELDAFFDNDQDQWASMRGSWTDQETLYVAMKAGSLVGHQTHNDLDIGDFVLDAMGTRWAGELGSGDYNSPAYFDNGNSQDATRWKYYRKMTEGQNTILINQSNQLLTAAPKIINSGSSNTKQGPTTVADIPSDSTAFWITDMTTAYSDATSVQRGVRLLNGRKQVLIQDEINASGPIQWRMHTNATVNTNGNSATLSLDGKTMAVSILNPTSGATFTTSKAIRFDTDPKPPVPDQDNPGVTVLIIALDAGTYNLQVLFTPQWGGQFTAVTPPSVDLANWSLTSHN